MNFIKVVKAAGKARRVKAVKPEVVAKAAGLLHSKGTVRAANDAGLLGVSEKAEDAARKTGDELSKVAQMEKVVRDAADGSKTSLEWMRLLDEGASNQAFEVLWHSFSEADKTRLMKEMIRRVVAGKEVDQNFVAGAIREMMAKELPQVKQVAMDLKLAISEANRGKARVHSLDTGVIGDVFMRTTFYQDGTRDIQLGTDRLIGTAHGAPEVIKDVMLDGKKIDITVQGRLKVEVAIEVKGRTRIRGAEKQILNLVKEGRGTGEYCVIDGKFWLLEYDPATVHHVIVAPRGRHFDRLNATKRLEGRKFTLVEIPTALDDQTKDFALDLMQSLKELAPELKRDAERAKQAKAAVAAAKKVN